MLDTGQFKPGTYDGYSSEPWLISLAAQLSVNPAHHVDMATHYHSAVKRVRAFHVNPGRSHLVHSSPNFRAPFLQWLVTLFVKVDDRGTDSYPVSGLASNPHINAVMYQLEAHARASQLSRATRLQPDAGDDGTGNRYEQFSYYKDFGSPDLYMSWAVAWSFLAEVPVAEAALRATLASGFHGPLGLTDSVTWPTGAGPPTLVTARHDFWNIALSTMAFVQYLYGGNQLLAALPEVQAALDGVFIPRSFIDDPLVPGVTPVRAVHFHEIRERIDLLRARNGLSAFNWTNSALVQGLTIIRAEHLTDLRSALDEVLDETGSDPGSWGTNPGQVRNTTITAQDLAAIRSTVKTLEAS